MMAPFTLRLPLPPSTNALFRNVPGIGRVKAAGYKRWLISAGAYGITQKPPGGFPHFERDFEIVILIPAKTRGDVDNRGKCVIDLMTAWQIISDDRHAQAVTIRRVLDMPEGECRVTVRSALPESVEAA